MASAGVPRTDPRRRRGSHGARLRAWLRSLPARTVDLQVFALGWIALFCATQYFAPDVRTCGGLSGIEVHVSGWFHLCAFISIASFLLGIALGCVWHRSVAMKTVVICLGLTSTVLGGAILWSSSSPCVMQ